MNRRGFIIGACAGVASWLAFAGLLFGQNKVVIEQLEREALEGFQREVGGGCLCGQCLGPRATQVVFDVRHGGNQPRAGIWRELRAAMDEDAHEVFECRHPAAHLRFEHFHFSPSFKLDLTIEPSTLSRSEAAAA